MINDPVRQALDAVAPNGSAAAPASPPLPGLGAAEPRWRIRHPQVKRVELHGPWVGAWLDMVLNPPLDVLINLTTAAGLRWHLHKIIRAWNFEDADGQALPVNEATVGALDIETVEAIQTAWGAARDLSKSGRGADSSLRTGGE